ncbi:hypothetical protein Q3H59_004152 [Pantoea sp. SORGH_AS 659]|nr:hypothetical protein [Pantoea sp. SORGH_AS_0659]
MDLSTALNIPFSTGMWINKVIEEYDEGIFNMLKMFTKYIFSLTFKMAIVFLKSFNILFPGSAVPLFLQSG